MALNESNHDPREHEWRKDVNRAVSTWASSLGILDDDAFAAAVTTMLRDIGEAISAEAAALVEFADDSQTLATGLHWHWSLPTASEPPFESAVLKSVIEHVTLEHEPVVLYEGHVDGAAENRFSRAMVHLKHTH